MYLLLKIMQSEKGYIYHNLKNIEIVNNAVSLENLKNVPENAKDFKLPNGKKLLYLTYYYPHKNLEILLPLAVLIKKNDLDYKFVITIESNQNPKAHEFLNKIQKLELQDVIINVGSVAQAMFKFISAM